MNINTCPRCGGCIDGKGICASCKTLFLLVPHDVINTPGSEVTYIQATNRVELSPEQLSAIVELLKHIEYLLEALTRKYVRGG